MSKPVLGRFLICCWIAGACSERSLLSANPRIGREMPWIGNEEALTLRDHFT
jgi:hypothetical protein